MEAARKLFLEERQSGIGGSDAAAIVGLNQYKSPIAVYQEKVGLTEPTPMNAAMKMGILLEPTIRDMYREVLDDRSDGLCEVQEHPEVIRHPNNDYLIAHVDGLIGKKGVREPFSVLEIKTAGAHMKKYWGDEYTDDIPESYLIQCQHYMGVTGVPICDVAVLFGGQEFQIFQVRRNDELIGDLFETLGAFWTDYILKQVPPPVDDSKSSTKLLKQMHPEDDGGEIEASEGMILALEGLRIDTGQKKKLETTIRGYRNHIKEFMGDNSIMLAPDGRVTWKKSKDSDKVDFKKVVEEMIEKAPDPITRQSILALVDIHTTTKPGSRRFLTRFDE